MKSLLLGALLAGIALFFLGFLFWGMGTAAYSALGSATDDVAAQQAIERLFPGGGSFIVPDVGHSPERMTELMASGPTAIVHVLPPPRDPVDPATLGTGLLHSIVFSFALGLVLRFSGVTGYGERVLLCAMMGGLAALMIDVSDAIWWQEAAAWKLTQGIYNILAFALAGAVLARFVKAPGAAG